MFSFGLSSQELLRDLDSLQKRREHNEAKRMKTAESFIDEMTENEGDNEKSLFNL